MVIKKYLQYFVEIEREPDVALFQHFSNYYKGGNFMYKLKLFLKYLFLFILGGLSYYGIEIAYRGYSHISMFIVGALCFIFIGLLNEKLEWDTYIEIQVCIGLVFVLALEFVAGCILNLWLGLGIWDYSSLPLNLFGQICIPFAILWIPIIIVAILLDDYVRYFCFHEEKPRYKSRIVEKIKMFLNKR